MLTNTPTTLVIIGLMAVLSIAAIATVAHTAMAARPPVTPPPNPGTGISNCAQGFQGPGAQGCRPPPGGP